MNPEQLKSLGVGKYLFGIYGMKEHPNGDFMQVSDLMKVCAAYEARIAAILEHATFRSDNPTDAAIGQLISIEEICTSSPLTALEADRKRVMVATLKEAINVAGAYSHADSVYSELTRMAEEAGG